jgi:hypothetical protein
MEPVLQILRWGLSILIDSILRILSLRPIYRLLCYLDILRTRRVILGASSVELWRSAQNMLRSVPTAHWQGLRGTLISCKTWINRLWSTSSWECRHIIRVNKFAGNELEEVTQGIVIFDEEFENLLFLVGLEIILRYEGLLQFLFSFIHHSIDSVLEGLNQELGLFLLSHQMLLILDPPLPGLVLLNLCV